MHEDATAATPIRIDDHPAAVDIARRIIEAARRTVWIRSYDLEGWLFGHNEVLQALRGFATSDREVQVQILLADALAAQRAHPPLLGLAQRLPSVFQFRELQDPVDLQDTTALIACDGGGYYLRRDWARVEGMAAVQDQARIRQLRAGFDETWQRARPVSEYRALGL